jgi:hypothetical protein
MIVAHKATRTRRVAALLGLIGIATTLLIAGCGKSVAERHEEAIRCGAFSYALRPLLLSKSSPLNAALDTAMAKSGITGDKDTQGMALMAAGATDFYAKSIDPAKVLQLRQEGQADGEKLIADNDADGIANYMKNCIDTFKSLAR